MQINLKLDCTLYTGFVVHFHRNIQLPDQKERLQKLPNQKTMYWQEL